MSDLSESVKIPGFRKGKIPKPVLVSRLGKERIYAEAVDSHIGGWFWSAASRSRVRPIADPQYEFELPSTADEAWSFAATVEVQALPEIVDWTTLEVAARRGRGSAGVDRRRDRGAARVRRRARAGRTSVPRARATRSSSISSTPTARRSATPWSSSAAVGSRPSSRRRSSAHHAGETKEVAFPLADGSARRVEITRARGAGEGPAADRRRARARGERVRHARRAAREHRGNAPRAARRRDRRGVPHRRPSTSSCARRRCSRRSRSSGRAPPTSSPASPARSSAAASRSRPTSRRAEASAQDLQRQMVLEAAVSVARELALEALAEKAGIESPTTT